MPSPPGCDVGSVRNVALGVTGALIALGTGQHPGEGTCEQYFHNTAAAGGGIILGIIIPPPP